MHIENLKNGHGYTLSFPSREDENHNLIFPTDAETAMINAYAEGNCLIEGGVGVGKSHLVDDITNLVRRTFDEPTFVLRGQISGGSKKGVSNALHMLDDFADNYRTDGILVIDNADYYGYSGSRGRRTYSLAVKHLDAARYLTELLEDPESPTIVGVAHTEDWRATHWKYAELRQYDEVTPTAQEFLDAFTTRQTFDGTISVSTANELLVSCNEFSEKEAKDIIENLQASHQLSYCIVSRLHPGAIAENGLQAEVMKIRQGTVARMGGAVALSAVFIK